MPNSASYKFRGGDSVGSVIGTENFGTNYLFHHDRVDADATFSQVIDRVGIDLIRYPGGTITEEYFDLANPTATVLASTFGRSDKTVTPIQDFLAFVAQSGAEAIIVLPTYRYFDDVTRQIDPAAEATVKTFVRAVLDGDYGNAAIKGFEIGNEWYQDRFDWSAAEFGEFQSQMAGWIDEVLQEDADWSETGVYIQAGRGDDDENGLDDNQEIAAQFSQQELDAVDGLISHFYASTSSSNPFVLGGNINTRLNDIGDHWNTSGADGLDLVVTEWNVGEDGPENTSITGLMRNVALLNVFSNMVERGVDLSAIWTAQAPSPAALSNSEGDEHLTSTGYLYRMMRRELIGTQAVDTVQDETIRDNAGNQVARSYVFQGEGKTVIYMASGVGEKVHLTADFGRYMSADSHVHATVLGVADGSTATDYRAVAEMTGISDGEIGNSGSYKFKLGAYEVVQLVITTGSGVHLMGDDEIATHDTLDGSIHTDELLGFDGNDVLSGFDGDDVLSGGAGADIIAGGDGEDTLDGGDGDDLITGAEGDDLIFTGSGSDTVDGGDGNDTLDYSSSDAAIRIYARDGVAEKDGTGVTDRFSGIENFVGSDFGDTIFTNDATQSVASGAGDDFIRVLGGDDTRIEAGTGDDFVLAEFGSASVDLGAGNDRLLSFAAEVDVNGGSGDDIIHGGNKNDTIDGGQGNDTLSGGQGEDTFVYNSGDGTDVILDFDTDEDMIDLSDLGITFGDLNVVSTGYGADLRYAGDSILELHSVSTADVTADLFNF